MGLVKVGTTGQGKQGRRPALWDGKASERIVAELDRLLA